MAKEKELRLERIQFNGHDALMDIDTGRIALLPEGAKILDTMMGVYGAIDRHGRIIELQFYARQPDDKIARIMNRVEFPQYHRGSY